MSSAQEVYARFLEKEYNEVLAITEKLDPAKRFTQIGEGKAHPLWILGHITGANNFLINMICCGGSNMLPPEWGLKFSPDFVGGIAPTPEADFYPSWDELVEHYEKVTKVCISSIRNLSDEALSADVGDPLPEELRESFKTVENTLCTVTLHSTYHRGQLSVIQLQD